MKNASLFSSSQFGLCDGDARSWRAGGIAVPLNVASAVSELDHYLTWQRSQD
ncbi:MAG: hypothetical protein Ct9H90mP25_0550 [Gammaproteobacteria bacterium]|nr:MAG: hypothetical protein Ct9H90mP25_0550 [Gammaproteobacteria bacterium]